MTTHIGLIGSGNITETHARAARAVPGTKISAIYGSNPQSVARLATKHEATPYQDFAAFLTHKPMDLVILGTPSGLHAHQGIPAAQQGLHVLTEKPLDITTKNVDALIAAAEKSNVKLGVIFQDRLKPNIQLLKHWLDRGLLGKPLLVDARVKWYRPPDYYSTSKWRGTFALDGGGALINQAIHTLDLLLYLLGDVACVQARTATVLHKIEAEDTAVATLEFASGALGIFHATTAAYPGYPRRVEISGTEGTVILEHDRIIGAHLQNSPAVATISDALADLMASAEDKNQSASSAAVSDFRGHQAALEDFLAAIRQNRASACDGLEGRRSLALIETIYRAAKTPDPLSTVGSA
jgi:predicted dehydrogenase